MENVNSILTFLTRKVTNDTLQFSKVPTSLKPGVYEKLKTEEKEQIGRAHV